MTTTEHEDGHSPAAPGAEEPPDPTLERFWAVLRRLPRYLALGVNLTRDRAIPNRVKANVLVGGAYAVSPVDLVPGVIPVAGQLDDMVVILVALRRALRACPPGLAAEHLSRVGLAAGEPRRRPRHLLGDRPLDRRQRTARWAAGWRRGSAAAWSPRWRGRNPADRRRTGENRGAHVGSPRRNRQPKVYFVWT